jgi:hypothetical protein
MILEAPPQLTNFNLDIIWVIIGVGFLIYVGWMIYMAIGD